jgi:hypothetical protein
MCDAGVLRGNDFVSAMPKPNCHSEEMGLYSKSAFTGLIGGAAFQKE